MMTMGETKMIELKARDSKGFPVCLGTMVRFMDPKATSHPIERVGPVEEITFKADGTNMVRVLGYKSKPVPSNKVTAVHLNDREALILQEFTKRGTRISLDEARAIANMLSLPEVPTIEPGEDSGSGEETLIG